MQLLIDKFGRMLLPKTLRNNFGLRAGDRLEAVEKGDEIILRPLHDEELVKSEKGILVFSGHALDDIERAVENARSDRERKLSSWEKI